MSRRRVGESRCAPGWGERPVQAADAESPTGQPLCLALEGEVLDHLLRPPVLFADCLRRRYGRPSSRAGANTTMPTIKAISATSVAINRAHHFTLDAVLGSEVIEAFPDRVD